MTASDNTNTDKEKAPYIVREFYRDVYTRQEKPVSIEFIEKLADDLVTWAQQEEALILTDFIHLKGIPEIVFYRWCDRYDFLEDAKKEAIVRIGSRREKGAIKKEYDSRMIMSRQHRYDRTWWEDEEKRAELKAKTQDKTEGDITYKIVVDSYKEKEERPTPPVKEEDED